MVFLVILIDQILCNSAGFVQRDFEAVRVDVGDDGEVAVRANGVVSIFVEGGGRVIFNFMVAVGKSAVIISLSCLFSKRKKRTEERYPSSLRIIATLAPLEEAVLW